jgi:hypothetical protein
MRDASGSYETAFLLMAALSRRQGGEASVAT